MRENFDTGEDSLEFKIPEKTGDLTALVDADFIPYLVGFTADIHEYNRALLEEDLYSTSFWRNCVSRAEDLLKKYLDMSGCDSAIFYITDSENNFRKDIADTKTYKGHRSADKPPCFYELKSWLEHTIGAVASDHCEADDEISIEAWKRTKDLAAEGIDMWKPAHKKWSSYIIISKDKDLNIIPGWHLNMDTGEKYWVDKLGSLDPVYKPKEVTEYELQPVFDGVATTAGHCDYLHDGVLYNYGSGPLSEADCKDVSNCLWVLDGRVQDLYKSGKDKGKPKFLRVNKGKMLVDVIDRLKGSGLKFFYSQLITGDTADCYSGIKGAGPAKAFDALNECRSERELYDTVYQMYREKYRAGAYDYMLEQAQLAWMQTYKGELWQHLAGSRQASFPL